MKQANNTFWVFLLTGVLLLSASCQKSRLNKETVSTEDQSMAEDIYEDLFKVVNETSKEEDMEGDGKTNLSFDKEHSYANCASVTFSPELIDTATGIWNPNWPKTMTIDFGDTNCVGSDGKSRRGKIVSIHSGKFRDAGTTITISTDDYFVEDYQVIGTKTKTNDGLNANGNLSYTVDVDGKIISPTGDEVEWTSTRTHEWTEGSETGFFTVDQSTGQLMGFQGILDDVWEITGNATGINRAGRNFTATVTTPLRIQFCSWIPEITEGVLELQPEDLRLRTVDYGDQTCDNQASVTVGNRTRTVNLRRGN